MDVQLGTFLAHILGTFLVHSAFENRGKVQALDQSSHADINQPHAR